MIALVEITTMHGQEPKVEKNSYDMTINQFIKRVGRKSPYPTKLLYELKRHGQVTFEIPGGEVSVVLKELPSEKEASDAAPASA